MLNRAFLITTLSFALPAVALAADTSSLGFVPLTSIPGIEEAGNASTLPNFLNTVYKLAIGVAAVLAVLQIVRAGIMYMGGDSVTEKKDAKNLIALSIGGLILVLSPVVVFSIINPKILNLEIGGLNDLTSTGFGKSSTFTGADAVLWVNNEDRDAAIKRCADSGGLISHVCVLKTDSAVSRVVPASEACKPEEVGQNVCRAKAGSPTSAEACKTQYASIQVAAQGGSCDASRNFSTIPNGCCAGAAAGAVCCGSLNRTEDTSGLQFGWKAWFKVPGASDSPVSTLYRSVLFGTKEACLANVGDSATFKNLPTGSTFDRTKGNNGYACVCDTPLSEQAQECKDFASTGLSAPKTKEDPTAGPDVTKSISFSYYLYSPLVGNQEFDGPAVQNRTAYNEYKTACEARNGVVGHDSNGTYRSCTSAELAGYTGAASRKDSLKCVDGTLGCNLSKAL